MIIRILSRLVHDAIRLVSCLSGSCPINSSSSHDICPSDSHIVSCLSSVYNPPRATMNCSIEEHHRRAHEACDRTYCCHNITPRSSKRPPLDLKYRPLELYTQMFHACFLPATCETLQLRTGELRNRRLSMTECFRKRAMLQVPMTDLCAAMKGPRTMKSLEYILEYGLRCAKCFLFSTGADAARVYPYSPGYIAALTRMFRWTTALRCDCFPRSRTSVRVNISAMLPTSTPLLQQIAISTS